MVQVKVKLDLAWKRARGQVKGQAEKSSLQHIFRVGARKAKLGRELLAEQESHGRTKMGALVPPCALSFLAARRNIQKCLSHFVTLPNVLYCSACRLFCWLAYTIYTVSSISIYPYLSFSFHAVCKYVCVRAYYRTCIRFYNLKDASPQLDQVQESRTRSPQIFSLQKTQLKRLVLNLLLTNATPHLLPKTRTDTLRFVFVRTRLGECTSAEGYLSDGKGNC